MSIDDIDLVEINEACAAQLLPIGPLTWASTSTGSTCTVAPSPGVTPSAPPERATRPRCSTDSPPATWTFGLETMCVGGGQGMTIIDERLS